MSKQTRQAFAKILWGLLILASALFIDQVQIARTKLYTTELIDEAAKKYVDAHHPVKKGD